MLVDWIDGCREIYYLGKLPCWGIGWCQFAKNPTLVSCRSGYMRLPSLHHHKVLFFCLMLSLGRLGLETQTPQCEEAQSAWKESEAHRPSDTADLSLRKRSTNLPAMAMRHLGYGSPSPKLYPPTDAHGADTAFPFESCPDCIMRSKTNDGCYFKPQHLGVCNAIINNWNIRPLSCLVFLRLCFPSCKMRMRSTERRVVIRIHGKCGNLHILALISTQSWLLPPFPP